MAVPEIGFAMIIPFSYSIWISFLENSRDKSPCLLGARDGYPGRSFLSAANSMAIQNSKEKRDHYFWPISLNYYF